ncbi:MAG TPA: DoxX family protein, partial [Gemmataceae bacterium]|nr:DoxX family protein [Gemmataceae bacterium]
QRLREYEAKAGAVLDALDRRLPAFNQDVEKVRLRTAKSEATAILTGLLNDLDARTAEMKRSLDATLTAPQKEKGPVPDAPTRKPIEWLDKATMCAHAVLGACLLLGLFSRLASFLLAMFLLSVTLVAPALPYSPTPPGAIGFYLYVNLYVIEMLALLALACMPTGRWFGVDALLHYLTHGRRRVRPGVVTNIDPHHKVRI